MRATTGRLRNELTAEDVTPAPDMVLARREENPADCTFRSVEGAIGTVDGEAVAIPAGTEFAAGGGALLGRVAYYRILPEGVEVAFRLG